MAATTTAGADSTDPDPTVAGTGGTANAAAVTCTAKDPELVQQVNDLSGNVADLTTKVTALAQNAATSSTSNVPAQPFDGTSSSS